MDSNTGTKPITAQHAFDTQALAALADLLGQGRTDPPLLQGPDQGASHHHPVRHRRLRGRGLAGNPEAHGHGEGGPGLDAPHQVLDLLGKPFPHPRDPGDGDGVDEARGVADHGGDAGVRGGGGEKEDRLQADLLGEAHEAWVLVGGKVGKDHPRGPRLLEEAEEALRPPGQDGVQVGHEEEGFLREGAHLADELQSALDAHPLPQGQFACPLDHGAVPQGVGVGEADLQKVGIGEDLLHRLQKALPAGEARGEVRDEGGPALGPGLGEGLEGGHSSPPRRRITSVTSLSPRPERLMTTTWSLSISGTTLAA